jgi:hypothetical protein
MAIFLQAPQNVILVLEIALLVKQVMIFAPNVKIPIGWPWMEGVFVNLEHMSLVTDNVCLAISPVWNVAEVQLHNVKVVGLIEFLNISRPPLIPQRKKKKTLWIVTAILIFHTQMIHRNVCHVMIPVLPALVQNKRIAQNVQLTEVTLIWILIIKYVFAYQGSLIRKVIVYHATVHVKVVLELLEIIAVAVPINVFW